MAEGGETTRSFAWDDPFDLDGQLSEDEKLVRASARAFAQRYLFPRVTKDYLEERFDREIMTRMGGAGLLGPAIPQEYGGASLGHVAYGLAAREVERADSGYRSMMSVQSSLVIHAIFAYGSETQRRKYLPRLATGEWIGCFGLTEPDAGSDPQAMRSKADKAEDGYKLTGAKTGITNSPVADVFVVWAKSGAHQNAIRGFLLERGMQGLATPTISQKLSLRAEPTGEIIMDAVKVPADNLLPDASGLKGPFGCLNHARYGICWGAMGAAEACFEAARTYTLQRRAVWPAACRQSADPKKTRRHANRNRARASSSFTHRPAIGRGEARSGSDIARQAQQCGQGARHRPLGARYVRCQRDLGRVPRHAPSCQSRNGQYLRGHKRYSRAHPWARDHRPAGVLLALLRASACRGLRQGPRR
jgi:glutaryl-CoA dehydrogenase